MSLDWGYPQKLLEISYILDGIPNRLYSKLTLECIGTFMLATITPESHNLKLSRSQASFHKMFPPWPQTKTRTFHLRSKGLPLTNSTNCEGFTLPGFLRGPLPGRLPSGGVWPRWTMESNGYGAHRV